MRCEWHEEDCEVRDDEWEHVDQRMRCPCRWFGWYVAICDVDDLVPGAMDGIFSRRRRLLDGIACFG